MSYYSRYMQICSNRCFFFSYQCKSTPLQVWKDKKSHVASFPFDYFPHCGPTSWPSLSRCDVLFGRAWLWQWSLPFLKNGALLYFWAHSPFFLQLLNHFWPPTKGKVLVVNECKGPVVKAPPASWTMLKVSVTSSGMQSQHFTWSTQKVVLLLYWWSVLQRWYLMGYYGMTFVVRCSR